MKIKSLLKIGNSSNAKRFLLIGLLFLFKTAISQEYSGKVVGISDGDAFTLLTPDKQQLKVRLSEIDAPEKAQPFGNRSRQALSDLIFSKNVLVVQNDIDRYGRLVGQVDINDDGSGWYGMGLQAIPGRSNLTTG